MSLIEVSFIIPVFNGEDYIERCLNSILAQKDLTSEIIVIDDGSVDGTCKKLEEYCGKFNNIIFEKQEHLGASVARNRGLDLAKGNWICFIDSDDYIEETIFESLRDCLNEDIDIIFADYSYIKKGGKKVFSSDRYTERISALDEKTLNSYFRATMNRNYNPGSPQVITPWAKLYKREFIEKNHLRFTPGIRKSQDVLFNFEVFCYAKNAVYVKELFYNYIYNPKSLCNKYIPGVLNDYDSQEKKMESILKKNGIFENFARDFSFRCIANLLYSVRLDYSHKSNPKKYSERREEFLEALNNENVKNSLENLYLKDYRLYEKAALFFIKIKSFFGINLFFKLYDLI